jgi:hypothetical protein
MKGVDFMPEIVVFWVFRVLLAAILLLPIAVIGLILEAIIRYDEKDEKDDNR